MVQTKTVLRYEDGRSRGVRMVGRYGNHSTQFIVFICLCAQHLVLCRGFTLRKQHNAYEALIVVYEAQQNDSTALPTMVSRYLLCPVWLFAQRRTCFPAKGMRSTFS